MTTIAVTGASGFLGSSLVPHLARSGRHHVLAMTRRMSLPMSSAETGGDVSWMQGDLSSLEDCRRLVESTDIIVHLAHSKTPITSDRDIPAEAQLSLVPTLNLVQAIRETGTRPHVVYASSGGAVYQPPKRRTPLRENSVCAPTSSYGIVKLAAEHYLRVAAAHGWLTATAARIANPYGTLLPMERMQGFIGVALNRIIHGQPVHIYGSPTNVRDYIHLEDVASFLDLVLNQSAAYETYNVGTGRGSSVRQILNLLGRLTGRPVRTELVPLPEAAHALPSWIVLDVSKARACLGWTPRIPLYTGLEKLCRNVVASSQLARLRPPAA